MPNGFQSVKAFLKTPFLLLVLIAGLGLTLSVRVTAQTFTILHSFSAISNSTNNDGTGGH
jgi:hypothetical protein